MIAQSSRRGIIAASSKAVRLRGHSAYVTIAMKIPTKIGVQNVVTKSDVKFWTVRMAFIVLLSRRRGYSAKIGFFVVELEVHQGPKHLQISNQRIHFGRHPCPAVEVAYHGLWIALCEGVRAGAVGIGLCLQ